MVKWIILAGLAALILGFVGLTMWVETEAPFRKERLATGTLGKALILYHPSRDAHFSEDLTRALARGFEEDGLKVERWTMTRRTPAKPEGFAIIALVSNTFFRAPDWPTQRYLERARFENQKLLVILGGGGNTKRAEIALLQAVERTGADPIALRSLWTSRPNQPGAAATINRALALEIAQGMAIEAGAEILNRPAAAAVPDAPDGAPKPGIAAQFDRR